MVFKNRKFFVTFYFILLMLGLTGCASLFPSKVFENPYLVKGPSEKSATVHFIRLKSNWASAAAAPVKFNREPLLQIRIETYTTVRLKPGRYVVTVGEKPTFLSGRKRGFYQEELTLSPGETYHLLLYEDRYGSGQFDLRIAFETIDEMKARELMEKFTFFPPPSVSRK